MKAQQLTASGGPENFRLVDLPMPKAGAGEVVVRQVATSVNPADIKIRESRGPSAPVLPTVLGMDVAGVVLEVGAGVTEFAPGDRVYGCAGGVRGLPGANAQAIAVDARLIAKAPRSLSLRDAAAMPLVTITVYEALFDRVRMRAGQRLLVHGGAGGVGHIAIQVAKAYGAHVTATVSTPGKAELARALGADEVVLYRSEGVAEYVQRITGGAGFDIVFDATGQDNYAASFAAAKFDGHVCVIVARHVVDLAPMHGKNLSLHAVFMLLPMLTGDRRERHGEMLRDAARLVDAGQLRVVLDASRFTLDELAAAHRRLESGQAVGKVVVDIAPE